MVAFSFFGISVYWYGIFYALTFLISYGILSFLIKRKVFSFLPEFQSLLEAHLETIFMFLLLGVLLGGRLGDIFIYNFSYYLAHPSQMIAFWKGGMSFIGGIIGVILSLIIFFWKYGRSWKLFFLLLDILLPFVALGIGLGRIGNFLNQELYGILVPSGFRGMGYVLFSILHDLQIFHVYSHVDTFLRVNTNLLASIFEGFLLMVCL